MDNQNLDVLWYRINACVEEDFSTRKGFVPDLNVLNHHPELLAYKHDIFCKDSAPTKKDVFRVDDVLSAATTDVDQICSDT